MTAASLSTKQCMKFVFMINTGAIFLLILLVSLFSTPSIKVFSLSSTAKLVRETRLQHSNNFNPRRKEDVSSTTNFSTTKNAVSLGNTLSPFWATFKNVYSDEDMKVQIQLMDVFDAAMRNASIPYFMYSGTLIGSWRHHGQIPWDDDVDLAVPFEQQTRVRNALLALSPAFRLDTQFAIRWKLYSNQSLIIPLTNHGWPYIDISFYSSNATHVWDSDHTFSKFCFQVDMIFPLRERPFLNRMFPAPAKTGDVLRKTYDLSVCLRGEWDHRKERWRAGTDRDKVPCKNLEDLHPFVRRTRVENLGCNETLMYNSNVISWYFNKYDVC